MIIPPAKAISSSDHAQQSSTGSYSIDHTAGSYIFDEEGRLRLFTRYGVGAQALADDIGQLLAD